MNDILDALKLVKPTYLVKTDKDIYRIQASTCSIDTDLKIICFYDKGSVQAMFRVDDVKTFIKSSDGGRDMLIKITAMLIVLTIAFTVIGKAYCKSLDDTHKLLFDIGHFTKGEQIFLFIVAAIYFSTFLSVIATAFYMIFKFL